MEFTQRVKGTEKVNNSLPMKDYELIMSVGKGELDELDEAIQDRKLEPLKKYFGMDVHIYEVAGYYDENKKLLENMVANKSGGMRATTLEGIKRLILLFGVDGRSKTISSDVVDTDEDSLDIYIQRIKDYQEGVANTFKLSDIKTTQSATLPNLVLTLARIDLSYGVGGEDSLPRVVRKYAKDSSQQNEKQVREKLSQKSYTELRDVFLNSLRKTIVDYMGAGDKSILHGRRRTEPYTWVKERVV